MQGAELKLEEALAALVSAWAKWTLTLQMIAAAAQAAKSSGGERIPVPAGNKGCMQVRLVARVWLTKRCHLSQVSQGLHADWLKVGHLHKKHQQSSPVRLG